MIRSKIESFNPDEVGRHLEEKGHEILELASSGSFFYISCALIVFIVLLIIGLFFKKAIKLAFFILFVAIIGYLILNYWSQMLDAFFAFIDWLVGGKQPDG